MAHLYFFLLAKRIILITDILHYVGLLLAINIYEAALIEIEGITVPLWYWEVRWKHRYCSTLTKLLVLPKYLFEMYIEFPPFLWCISCVWFFRLVQAIDRFRANEHGILIATDAAARGLDIPGVRTVVHYQLPLSAEVSCRHCSLLWLFSKCLHF